MEVVAALDLVAAVVIVEVVLVGAAMVVAVIVEVVLVEVMVGLQVQETMELVVSPEDHLDLSQVVVLKEIDFQPTLVILTKIM